MRKLLLLLGLAGVLSTAPAAANAAPCYTHRVAGTLLGSSGGALIATAAAAGAAVTPWAWAGAGIGALIGHAIGVHACHQHIFGYYGHPYYGYYHPYYGHPAYYGYYAYPPPPHPYYHHPRHYRRAYYAGYPYHPAYPPPHAYYSGRVYYGP